jgi:hypothetical protein
MPTIHFIFYLVNLIILLVVLFTFGYQEDWWSIILPIVLIISLTPLAFGILRRSFAIRCPGCKSWFVRVDFSEGKKGGHLFGLSWFPMWVETLYHCEKCGHDWTKISRLQLGDDD